MRVHAREEIAVELCLHQADQLLHAHVIVCPVAHHLQRVRQIAKNVGVVCLEGERRAVVLDGLDDNAEVFADTRQVVVVVGRLRIDAHRIEKRSARAV